MENTEIQKEILGSLTELKKDVSHLKGDIHVIMERLEDSRLSVEEREQIEESMSNIKQGNHSEFVPWPRAKKI